MGAYPLLRHIVIQPQNDFFTEFSILGPEHMAENYPSAISTNTNYNLFLHITNNMGSVEYYQIRIKFRNETQSAPDPVNNTPSTLSSLFTVNSVVDDKSSWELPLELSFDYSKVNAYQIVFNSVKFNDLTLNLNNLSSEWDSTRSVFYGNLIFELWIYNNTTNSFQYTQLFNSLLLNMTI